MTPTTQRVDSGATLTIAEAAEKLGLTTHTLRYYERDGLLLDAVDRATSGHRRYGARDLEWITLVTRLRSTGMPIREIRAYTELCRAGEGNEPRRLELLRAHRERVLAQLAEVTDHLGAITRKIDIYENRIGWPER
ncbi:MerR family transcriptional regulator [Rhodococcus triatomae]|uniref:DNA-binding transcriptional regulator, MerR family n=1 Tax=Rhodococcus triatomae TaxID=300028 RepID=A0A1G8J242_9NOCA|nr:MerR family transcriptional regulator [Rhodococcus triatomae]QNG19833.1 MerR family transcriptional regulator [Rhodococcus triatomae]QNG24251.1 MerR family transcriptional regulator [Rhodococcus triatomae]SDI25368.1 DNA-binding transcriptional regulator, MerR family [Rhodococcus triatomae]